MIINQPIRATSIVCSTRCAKLNWMSVCALFVQTLLEAEKNGRTVYQYHFKGWPDFGVPKKERDVTDFINKFLEQYHKTGRRGPIVMHCRFLCLLTLHMFERELLVLWALCCCSTESRVFLFLWVSDLCSLVPYQLVSYSYVRSAGVGRTGTVLVLSLLLSQLKDNPKASFDIRKTILDLREMRSSLVQTQEQFEFIYKALAAALPEYFLKCSSIYTPYIQYIIFI